MLPVFEMLCCECSSTSLCIHFKTTGVASKARLLINPVTRNLFLLNYGNFCFLECIALYTYSGETGDLSFQEGDVISITKSDGDWWEGTVNGRKGIFPANYVKMKEAEVNTVPQSSIVLL
jgi:hypothetical protein